MAVELKKVLQHPEYPGTTYRDWSMMGFTSWDFEGFEKESMSWKEGCYVHAGLSGVGMAYVAGPDALAYLQSMVVNSLAKFPVDSIKHLVVCDEQGMIASHGICERISEDEFLHCIPMPELFAGQLTPPEGYDLKLEVRPWFIFQIAGPTSLALIEKMTGADHHDLKFLHRKDTTILGEFLETGESLDVELARIGMARNLAYEFHGPAERAAEVYDAIVKAGQEFGIVKLGWETYWVNHTEGGFVQLNGHFEPQWWIDVQPEGTVFPGSADPSDVRARLRTPFEAGWGNLVKFDHDFPGRAALELEAANPKRTTVTLEWNPDDVAEVYKTWLEPGEELPLLRMPIESSPLRGFHQDLVLKDGREIGFSSGYVYSYYFRKYLSFGCIDLDQTEIGNEVSIVWGNHGERTMEIRAKVAPFPYISGGKFGMSDAK